MASEWEQADNPVLNQAVKGRERSVVLPWQALRHQLDLVAEVGGTGDRYYNLAYRTGKYYINDGVELVDEKGKEGEGWDKHA